jgi:hypothetical protein
VREDELANAGRRELIGDDLSESANAGNEDRGVFEPLLAGFAEVFDPDLPFVDGAVFGAE